MLDAITGERTPAILLPGVVMPAASAYADLLEALGDEVDIVAKELELYAAAEPPAGYGVDTEINGILRAADEAGFERFHLVGYSGGGAACLAFAASRPERLLSLAVSEPAWAGFWDLDPAEQALWDRFFALADGGLAPDELMAAFVRAQLRPGVEPPPRPSGAPPPWMATRPAGVVAIIESFRAADIDPERLRAFGSPVYFALGSLSNPEYWERMSRRLATLFEDFTCETWEGRHHFDPPHRAEPDRFAAALRAHWERA